jgi:hypothetical protein
MKGIGIDKVNRFCTSKHHLTNKSKIDDIVKIVNDIGGLHATSSATMYLSLFARMNNFEKEDLNQQLYTLKNLGKIRFVRGTMYVLTKDMIPVAYSATKGIFSTLSKKYAEYHGITDKEFKKTSKQITEILHGESMTTSEISKALNSKSKISPVINLMCDSGLLIRSTPKAGWRSNLHTYQSMDKYFPGLDLFSIPEYGARKEVVKQYIASFGPVSTIDISWWTGFTKTEIRKIVDDIKKEITEVNIADRSHRYYILKSHEKPLRSTKLGKKPYVILLPILDPYIMGYKVRDRYLDDKYFKFIFDRSGNATSSILVNGKIAGVWSLEENLESIVKIHLFKKALKDIKSEIRNKAKNIGEFIVDGVVKVKECKKMVPLDKRTAGSFMVPLKGS